MQLTELSDEELVSRLTAICLEGHAVTARLIVHLVEVEERRLDLRAACTSMMDFCVRRLGMSEGAAFRRINAARLVRRFPGLLARIEGGALHLSTLVLLRPHLNDANVDELAAAVAGKTQRDVEEMLARLAPKPDVPSTIVELPVAPVQADLRGSGGQGPALGGGIRAPVTKIQPLSESRFKVQLTASTELRDKLERARDLMSHRNPSGDLAVVVERALDLLLDKLERERLGKTTRPSPSASTTTRPGIARGGIPRSVRREVFERDGGKCTFVDNEGRRCGARARLELDHAVSHALGGPCEAANLRLRCRAHNRLHAEEVFGKAHVARAIDFRQRKSRRVTHVEPSPESPAEVMEVAMRGLVSLGFTRPDAWRALDVVSRRRSAETNASTWPVQEVLREAIAALT